MREKGTHTYEIIVNYQRCPACGYVFENRKLWVLRGKSSEVDLTCPRCQKEFVVKRFLRQKP